jgi:hypothetical protein
MESGRHLRAGWGKAKGRRMIWQPIETAPRDGTWVLVMPSECPDEAYQNRPVSAQWTNERNSDTAEWRWQFAWYDGGYYGSCNPTHWQPLPEPPA